METGTIVRWLKSEGDQVENDEAETEARVPPGTEEDETPGRLKPGETGPGVEKPAEAPAREDERERGRETREAEDEPTQVTRPERVAATTDGGRVKASPLARRIAKERGIELSGVKGTGPEGRIVAEDVERAATAPTREPP